MKKIREPEEVLNRFPWRSLVVWTIFGTAAGPIAMGLLYFIGQFVFWLVNGVPVTSAFEAIVNGAARYTPGGVGWAFGIDRTDLFREFSGVPGEFLYWYLALFALPGAIIGCVLYVVFRKKEISMAREVLEKVK